MRIPLFPSILGGTFVLAACGLAWARGEPARELGEREAKWGTRIQAGDLVFQDLDCGRRCELIREVTHSRYAHVGIVLDEGEERVVWEALGPVGPVRLADWVQRGRGGQVAVYRMGGALQGRLPEIAHSVRQMRGLPYDADYQWDDERIYCSELVEKAVERGAGQTLVAPHPLGPGAFGAFAAEVARRSGGRLTERTPLVTPSDLTRAPGVERVLDELSP
jgi:hypothetical protein